MSKRDAAGVPSLVCSGQHLVELPRFDDALGHLLVVLLKIVFFCWLLECEIATLFIVFKS